MGVKASPEAIRDMKKDLQNTVKDLEKICEGIRSGMSASESWDDAKAAQFNQIMQRTARLTEQPIETLNAAVPKLEKLAQSLDNYNSVSFN